MKIRFFAIWLVLHHRDHLAHHHQQCRGAVLPEGRKPSCGTSPQLFHAQWIMIQLPPTAKEKVVLDRILELCQQSGHLVEKWYFQPIRADENFNLTAWVHLKGIPDRLTIKLPRHSVDDFPHSTIDQIIQQKLGSVRSP